MRCIAIAGVGLIGGSLGLAFRKAGFLGTILGVSSETSTSAGIRLGAIDRAATLDEAVAEADLIYLAQPIGIILDTLKALAGRIRPGTLVTDAGSTKAFIVRRAAETIGPASFLGGHPMAGKESRGVEVAEAGLFEGRRYVLTPGNPSDLETPVASVFVSFLKKCGARVITATPEEHDHIVAMTSHLPQVLSTALSGLLADRPDAELAMSGPGLVDMTRLAMSSWDVWKDILDTNGPPIEHAINVYLDKLTELRDNLQTQSLGPEFRIAADMAKRLRR